MQNNGHVFVVIFSLCKFKPKCFLGNCAALNQKLLILTVNICNKIHHSNMLRIVLSRC